MPPKKSSTAPKPKPPKGKETQGTTPEHDKDKDKDKKNKDDAFEGDDDTYLLNIEVVQQVTQKVHAEMKKQHDKQIRELQESTDKTLATIKQRYDHKLEQLETAMKENEKEKANRKRKHEISDEEIEEEIEEEDGELPDDNQNAPGDDAGNVDGGGQDAGNANAQDPKNGDDDGQKDPPVDENKEAEVFLDRYFKTRENFGEPVMHAVRDSIIKFWQKPLIREKERHLLEKYMCPENCKELAVPPINNLVWKGLPQNSRDEDMNLQKIEKIMLKSQYALMPLIEWLVKDKDHEMAEYILDSNQLIAIAHKYIIDRRREILREEMAPEYKALAGRSDDVSHEGLLGPNLEEKIKTLKDTGVPLTKKAKYEADKQKRKDSVAAQVQDALKGFKWNNTPKPQDQIYFPRGQRHSGPFLSRGGGRGRHQNQNNYHQNSHRRGSQSQYSERKPYQEDYHRGRGRGRNNYRGRGRRY